MCMCVCGKEAQARENRPHIQMEDLLSGFCNCIEEVGVVIVLVSLAGSLPLESRKEVTGDESSSSG